MKLDSRILEGKKPLDCIDAESESVKSFIGKKGYFADHISEFANISDLKEHVLTCINPDEPDCEVYKTNCTSWEYFLPEEWVEEPEKKYRPYTIKDFEKAFLNGEFEDFIIFRDKHEPDNIYTMRYNGNYTRGKYEYICLGAKNYSFESLFENYEVADYDGDWQPFGVEVSRDENQGK